MIVFGYDSTRSAYRLCFENVERRNALFGQKPFPYRNCDSPTAAPSALIILFQDDEPNSGSVEQWKKMSGLMSRLMNLMTMMPVLVLTVAVFSLSSDVLNQWEFYQNFSGPLRAFYLKNAVLDDLTFFEWKYAVKSEFDSLATMSTWSLS
jgi:hypothetical protein